MGKLEIGFVFSLLLLISLGWNESDTEWEIGSEFGVGEGLRVDSKKVSLPVTDAK